MKFVGQLAIAGNTNHVIEQPDLRPTEPAVATESALEKDSLRNAVAGDQLYVLLEHGVIQLLAVFAAHEVRAERLEDVFQRKGTRPFADSVRDGDLPREDVPNQHVVGIRSVIHQVDHDRIPGQLRRFTRVFGGDLIKEVEKRPTDDEAELVVRQNVEERDDL